MKIVAILGGGRSGTDLLQSLFPPELLQWQKQILELLIVNYNTVK